MVVISRSPFETSFENLSAKATGGLKKVQKAASDAAGVVAADVKGQLVGQPASEQSLVEAAGVKQVSPQQQQQVVAQQQQVLNQTRQNLERINQEIKAAREARIKKEQETKKADEQQKQKKKVEEQKKKEDPVWKRLLKGKMGSREAAQRSGG